MATSKVLIALKAASVLALDAVFDPAIAVEIVAETPVEQPPAPPVDPVPVPPTPPVDPAPTPAPTPVPPIPPVPTDWRATVEALRAFQPVNPRDVGAAALTAKGVQSISGYRHDFQEGGAPAVVYPVNIPVGAEISELSDFAFFGPYGQGTALKMGKTVILQNGILRKLSRGRFEGWPCDTVRIRGVKGDVQTLSELYFGPQWTRSPMDHSDMIVVPELLGDIMIDTCLFDHVEPATPGLGDNNWLRLCRDTGSVLQGKGTVRVTRSIVHGIRYPSYLIQIVHGAGYAPQLELDDVCLPITKMGMDKLFHPSTPLAAVRWGKVWDTDTGVRISAPAGVTVI
jgi:hypothetical protein